MLSVTPWNPLQATVSLMIPAAASSGAAPIPGIPGSGDFDVRAEAAAQLRSLGLEPVYLTRAEKDGFKAGAWPKDEAGAKRFIIAWATYLAEESIAIEYEFGITNFWLTMGVADCDTLTHYNNRALSNYIRLSEMYDSMVKGGVHGLGVPPFPRLFGTVTDDFSTTGSNIRVDLPRCQAGYPVEPVYINAPRIPANCLPPSGGLTLAFLAPAVPYIAAAIFVAITGYVAYKIISELGSNQRNEITGGMDERRARQDAKRAEWAQKCFLGSIAPNMSIDEQRKVRESCTKQAMGIYPDRPIPELETSSFFGQIGKAALYIGIGAVLLFGGLAAYKAVSK